MRSIHVDVAVKPLSYEVYAGSGLFGQIARDLAGHPLGNRAALITDSHVGALYAGRLEEALREQDIAVQTFMFPEGESSKNRAQKEKLEDAMMEAGYGRDSYVLALGGGVTGDLAGFVAATYMRGVPVVQIPTSTLAMADSAIGSKTAVDVPYGKNLIGAFHSPVAVYMDMRTLATLDERNYYAGLVELIKHSFIRNPELAKLLEAKQKIVTARRGDAEYEQTMEELFLENSKVKNAVVSEDQLERGIRGILNYGHTLGHAVELLSGYKMIHGECVAVGIAYAAYLSQRLGFGTEDYAGEQVRLLRRYRQECRIPEEIRTEDILEVMKRDKKVRQGRIAFVLLSGPGQIVTSESGACTVQVPEETLLETVRDFRKI